MATFRAFGLDGVRAFAQGRCAGAAFLYDEPRGGDVNFGTVDVVSSNSQGLTLVFFVTGLCCDNKS